MDPAIKLASEVAKHYEGLYLTAYRCSAGKLTIGYGHTKSVKEGQSISSLIADRYLQDDLEDAEMDVERLVKVDLEPHEAAALVDFVFNLGGGALAQSTVLKKLNAGDRQGAADAILMWNKCHTADGFIELKGLTRRRKCERHLFLTGDVVFSEED